MYSLEHFFPGDAFIACYITHFDIHVNIKYQILNVTVNFDPHPYKRAFLNLNKLVINELPNYQSVHITYFIMFNDAKILCLNFIDLTISLNWDQACIFKVEKMEGLCGTLMPLNLKNW